MTTPEDWPPLDEQRCSTVGAARRTTDDDIEDHRFTRRVRGHELGPPWDTVDWDADPDWECHSASDDMSVDGLVGEDPFDEGA